MNWSSIRLRIVTTCCSPLSNLQRAATTKMLDLKRQSTARPNGDSYFDAELADTN